jgi:hypothetical protein
MAREMDEPTQALFQAIAVEADELADDVENAYDEHAAFSFQLATRRKVDALSARFREAYAKLDEKDRATVDRGPGRRLSDLQKLAQRLPTLAQGKPAEKPADNSFFGTRAPKSSRPPVVYGLAPGETMRDRSKIRVTDETEAWCGRCNMVRTQVVAAVVGDQPAQVVCQVCGTRSRYREGPARKKEGDAAPARKSTPSPAERAKDAKQTEKNALVQELQAAENVRKFSPKERYKAGEIIEHPEHGRGKIENTLPRSLLVRFAGGLKPLKLS